MGLGRGKSEGGSGGKLGHSNMIHYEYSEEVKIRSRKRRRLDARKQIHEELKQTTSPKQTV